MAKKIKATDTDGTVAPIATAYLFQDPRCLLAEVSDNNCSYGSDRAWRAVVVDAVTNQYIRLDFNCLAYSRREINGVVMSRLADAGLINGNSYTNSQEKMLSLINFVEGYPPHAALVADEKRVTEVIAKRNERGEKPKQSSDIVLREIATLVTKADELADKMDVRGAFNDSAILRQHIGEIKVAETAIRKIGAFVYASPRDMYDAMHPMYHPMMDMPWGMASRIMPNRFR
jgi:hypothetical protein